MVRILQISDTHLSAGKPHFASNWAPLAEWARAEAADLIIHSGDLTVDGADEEGDLTYCAELLGELGSPVLIIPGNHDVGDAGNPHQPVTRVRLERWRRHFGPDWWHYDIGAWRLIGLDALLVGSGTAEEPEQFAWLERTMAEAAGRRLAWFLHKPLFLDSPEEPDSGYWAVKPASRQKLLTLASRAEVALVASGHLHKRHAIKTDGIQYVWCPSAGFVCGPATQPPMPGDAVLGAVAYEFHDGGFGFEFAEIPGFTAHCIDDVVHDVYPAPA